VLQLCCFQVNEYEKGVGLAPHVDTHVAFEGAVLSLSLAGPCIMEFRRLREPDSDASTGRDTYSDTTTDRDTNSDTTKTGTLIVTPPETGTLIVTPPETGTLTVTPAGIEAL